jgi:PAS domain S-box-containing protein
MFNKEFLKTLVILYVEDDRTIRESLGTMLQKVFKKVIICTDGQDGWEQFNLNSKKNIQIDAIISDINMPGMNGLDMLTKVRTLDNEIPAILTTAHNDSSFLMEAIKVNVSYYALKPINTTILLENIQKFCMIKHQRNLIIRKEEELSAYIDAIDHVATIVRVDKDGNFTEVNELFCEVSLYNKEELLTKNIKDLTHQDILSSVFTSMQKSIQSGKTWEGLYKSIDRNNDTFYLKLSAIPEFDDSSNQMKGCIFIGFIATEDEQEKREIMQKVRQNIIEQKKKETKLQHEIQLLQSQNSKHNDTISSEKLRLLQESIDKYKNTNVNLLKQVDYYEKTISVLEHKVSTMAKAELKKRKYIADQNKELKKEQKILQEKLIHMQNQLNKYEKKDKKIQ